MIDTLNKQTRIQAMTNNRNKIKIEVNNKYLAFCGNANEAIDFVDEMRERESNNDVSDFLFNIERGLQDAGVYDEHFNLIEHRPEVYSGILKSGVEVMLRENGDDEWTVDVRDRNDEYILGFQFCDYDQALEKYNELEKNFNKYPFLEGDCYWTIEARYDIVESTWDFCSEEMHDERPHQVYYASESDAIRARKKIIIDFLIDEKNACSVHFPINIYNRIINQIKKGEIVA